MPAFGAVIPEEDIANLIVFIRSLNPERVVPPPASTVGPASPRKGDTGS
jgi:hypothetical protein